MALGWSLYLDQVCLGVHFERFFSPFTSITQSLYTTETAGHKNTNNTDVASKETDALYRTPLVLFKRNNPILRRRNDHQADLLDPSQVTLPGGKVLKLPAPNLCRDSIDEFVVHSWR